jgi:hypothetical protein
MNKGTVLPRDSRRPISEEEARRIIKGFHAGSSITELALRFHRGKRTIQKVLEGNDNAH